MNSVNLTGRLVADPEIRVTQDQSRIAKIRLAVNRNSQNTDFINCTGYEKTAELLEKYFHKGDRIGITGSIRSNSYKNKEGKTMSSVEVWIDRLDFIQDKATTTEDDDLPFR